MSNLTKKLEKGCKYESASHSHIIQNEGDYCPYEPIRKPVTFNKISVAELEAESP